MEDMAKLSNSEVARTLGMSHSSVSRMRSGQRVASIDVLELIVENYGVDSEELLHAAASATRGDVADWCSLLDTAFRDDQPDEEDSELVPS